MHWSSHNTFQRPTISVHHHNEVIVRSIAWLVEPVKYSTDLGKVTASTKQVICCDVNCFASTVNNDLQIRTNLMLFLPGQDGGVWIAQRV